MTDRAQLLVLLKRLRANVILNGHAVPVFMMLFGGGDPNAGRVAELLEQQATPARYRAARALERWLETGTDQDAAAASDAVRASVFEREDLWTWVERQPLDVVVKLIDRAILKGAPSR